VQGLQVQIDSKTRQYLCVCPSKARKLNEMLQGAATDYKLQRGSLQQAATDQL